MLDIGWGELLIIGVVALIVVGPKDLPKLFRSAGQFMGRARTMAREFQRSMEQAADETGLKEASDGLKSISRLNLNSPTNSARKYAEGLVKGIDAAASETPKTSLSKSAPPAAEPTAAAAKPAASPRAAVAAPEAAAEPVGPEPVKDPAGP